MSDDFIPFHQSTPQSQWNPGRNGKQRFSLSGSLNNYERQSPRTNRWQGHYRNQSFPEGRSHRKKHNSNEEEFNVNAYLHPSMLQDPWYHLREQRNAKNSM